MKTCLKHFHLIQELDENFFRYLFEHMSIVPIINRAFIFLILSGSVVCTALDAGVMGLGLFVMQVRSSRIIINSIIDTLLDHPSIWRQESIILPDDDISHQYLIQP